MEEFSTPKNTDFQKTETQMSPRFFFALRKLKVQCVWKRGANEVSDGDAALG